MLTDALEASNHPTRDLVVHAFGASDVEIEAVLMSTSVDGDQLDAVVARLAESETVSQAFWSPSTTE
jgi:putative Mg2+ transporter-C (MgtC) family protein